MATGVSTEVYQATWKGGKKRENVVSWEFGITGYLDFVHHPYSKEH
jgi:hypothetical protein